MSRRVVGQGSLGGVRSATAPYARLACCPSRELQTHDHAVRRGISSLFVTRGRTHRLLAGISANMLSSTAGSGCEALWRGFTDDRAILAPPSKDFPVPWLFRSRTRKDDCGWSEGVSWTFSSSSGVAVDFRRVKAAENLGM